ncbi:hypothetical protein H6F88_04605 [Oculatella sp. FACHB-28]|nr:hypothetical protein [Oculatella sp. FACHB-28]MBD2055311.1 hypothetical protein [Oculatella sp. FACHB-28]
MATLGSEQTANDRLLLLKDEPETTTANVTLRIIVVEEVVEEFPHI